MSAFVSGPKFLPSTTDKDDGTLKKSGEVNDGSKEEKVCLFFQLNLSATCPCPFCIKPLGEHNLSQTQQRSVYS